LDCHFEAWTKISKLSNKNTNSYLLSAIGYVPIVLLFWAISLSGCRERQFARATPQMDTKAEYWVRVLLLDNVATCRLKSRTGFSVLDPETLTTQAHFEQVDVPLDITISSGQIIMGGRDFTGSGIVILPDEPYILNVNGEDYRGKLKFVLNPDGKGFDVINLVPIEPYLAGVIGAEMPDYWESAALEAQAIAARTYCLYIKRRFGSGRSWDLKKTQAHQVYRGVRAESSQVWNAVNITSGQVLLSKKRDSDGDYELFPAFYSSACGGHTEDSNKVFSGDSFESLVGVRCPYCKAVARPRFFLWPMVQFDKAEVTEKLLKKYPSLKALGQVVNIAAQSQSNYGDFSRLTSVTLGGSTGKIGHLKAEDLRLTIDPSGRKIRSTICQIVGVDDKWRFLYGRGWGHGVGMCQCGAQAMARGGKTAREILSYYYRGSRTSTIDY